MPNASSFDMIASMKKDDTLVLGHKSSEWVVPTMMLGFCGGVASAFNPVIGGLLCLLSFLCSIALLKSFLKTVEKIAKVNKS